MNLTEKVLEQLIMADEPVSGEALAKILSVSRNAVWKAVEALRKQGYKIDAATNKGYILSSENLLLSGIQIKKALKNNADVLFFNETDSTNAVIKQIAEEGAKEGTVAVALSQTAGRGRLGRSFFSPCTGIYFSILLRPSFSPQQSLMLTIAAAVAVCRAIEKNSDAKCEIKWVNDIYINGKKVCGILTEGAIEAETATLKYAIVGIGINLTAPDKGFPEDIADRASAIYKIAEITAEKKAQLIADIIDEFFIFYEGIEDKKFLPEYRSRSYLTGKTVTYERGGAVYEAKVSGIDDNGGLEILQNGVQMTITAGDVSVKYKSEDENDG